MSIEQSLERIATALEQLTKNTPTVPLHIQEIETALAKPEQPASEKPTAPKQTATRTYPKLTTVAEVRDFAQKIGTKLPPANISKFTDFVRTEINARLGIKQLKELSKPEDITFATERLCDFVAAEGIDV